MTLDLHDNHQLEAEVAKEQNKKINRINTQGQGNDPMSQMGESLGNLFRQ
jgi:hypothetical protein